MLFDANLGFVLGEDLILRKFKLLAGAVDGIENNASESLHDELMARFALFSAELNAFYPSFARAMKLQPAMALAA
jgi:recombination associated protein RdgC